MSLEYEELASIGRKRADSRQSQRG